MEFVTPTAQGAPSYTGASEGIRTSANTSIGTLFEGLADALGKGVTAVDEGIKAKIEQDVFDQVDAVQAEFGIPEATDLQADPGEKSFRTMPIGVQRAGAQLDTLQQAYQSGALRESHYWARMNSMVRQLRGKYPGYRAEIDQMVSSVTGARPANALRSALFAEWNASQNEGLSEEDKFVNANQDTIPPDYWDRKGTPSAYTLDEVRAYSSKKNRMRFEMDTRSKEMDLEASRDNLVKKDVTRNFSADATQIVNSVLLDVNQGIGKTFQDLTARVEEFRAASARGDPATAQQLEQLKAAVAQVGPEMQMTLYRHYAGNPHYTSMMTEPEVQAAISQAMQPITLLQQAIADEDFGLAKSVMAHNAALQNDATREILNEIPQTRRLAALSSLIGADGMSLAMIADPAGTSALTTVLKSNAEAGMLLGESDLKTSFDEGIKHEADANYFNALASWGNVIEGTAAGAIPAQVFSNKVQAMFSPGSDAVLNDPQYFKNDASRFKFFQEMASPAISQGMAKLRDQGFTAEWDTYQRWVARNFTTLFMSKVRQLHDLRTSPDQFYRVEWNDAGSRFDVDFRLFGDVTMQSVARTELNQLNSAIQVVRPIIEYGKGDVPFEIMDIFQEMGYDPKAGTSPHFIQKLIDAVTNAMSKRGPDEEGSQNG